MNTVFEVGPADRRKRDGTVGSGVGGGRVVIEFDASPVGEEPVALDRRGAGGAGLGWEGTSLDRVDIEPAVTIEVGPGNSAINPGAVIIRKGADETAGDITINNSSWVSSSLAKNSEKIPKHCCLGWD